MFRSKKITKEQIEQSKLIPELLNIIFDYAVDSYIFVYGNFTKAVTYENIRYNPEKDPSTMDGVMFKIPRGISNKITI